jgi:hypothetical protein
MQMVNRAEPSGVVDMSCSYSHDVSGRASKAKVESGIEDVTLKDARSKPVSRFKRTPRIVRERAVRLKHWILARDG